MIHEIEKSKVWKISKNYLEMLFKENYFRNISDIYSRIFFSSNIQVVKIYFYMLALSLSLPFHLFFYILETLIKFLKRIFDHNFLNNCESIDDYLMAHAGRDVVQKLKINLSVRIIIFHVLYVSAQFCVIHDKNLYVYLFKSCCPKEIESVPNAEL